MPSYIAAGKRYIVEVIAFDGDRVVETLGPFSAEYAEKLAQRTVVAAGFYVATRRARWEEFKDMDA